MEIQIIGPINESSRKQLSYSNESTSNLALSFGAIDVPNDFNSYDLNIISLADSKFWENTCNNRTDIVDKGIYLKALSAKIETTHSLVAVALPHHNLNFHYQDNFRHTRGKPIKSMLEDVMSIISKVIWLKSFGDSIACVSGITTIQDYGFKTEFFIKNTHGQILSAFDRSPEKATTTRINNTIVTTLPLLESPDALLAFVKLLDIEETSETPEWFALLPPMFDDARLQQTITNQNLVIENAKKEILNAEEKLSKNNEFKSIVYENGKSLEDTVRKMLGVLFDWDYESFVDHGTSDFIIAHANKYYVGEIKGENSNVTNKHLSQLQLNTDIDQEEGRIPEDAQIISLLIANTFRKTDPASRAPVDEKQVLIAKERNDALIVTTPVFLSLFEAVANSDIGKDDAISLLSRKGILLERDIKAISAEQAESI